MIDLIVGKNYRVTKTIKLHTKPLRTVNIVQYGKFVKETMNYLVFGGFKVRKSVISNIEMAEAVKCDDNNKSK
jgi:hypothetical protein